MFSLRCMVWRNGRSWRIWRSCRRSAGFEQHVRGAPVGSVAERNHCGVLFQHRMHDSTLYAEAAAVDDPHLAEASLNRLIQVLFYHHADVPRLEAVQIDRV